METALFSFSVLSKQSRWTSQELLQIDKLCFDSFFEPVSMGGTWIMLLDKRFPACSVGLVIARIPEFELGKS